MLRLNSTNSLGSDPCTPCVCEQETVSLDPKALANGLAEVYRIEALERIEAARRDLQVRDKQTHNRAGE